MNRNKRALLPFLLIIILIVSCGQPAKTTVTILSCVDTVRAEIQETVTVTVDGITQTWLPGDPLEFVVDMHVNHGFVQVTASSANYRMVSPREYEVNRSKGLELVLVFEARDDEVPLDELAALIPDPFSTEIEPDDRPDPQNMEVRFDVTPGLAEVTIIMPNNSRESFRGSRELTLLEDTYRWQAALLGYDDAGGTFTVRAGTENRVTINLQEEVLDDGTLSTLIDPQHVMLRLRNVNTGEEESFTSVGMRTISLYPGLYRYTLEAPGYRTEEGEIRIREAADTRIEMVMVNMSASALMETAREIRTGIQAERFFNALQNQWPIQGMDIQTRDNLIEELSRIADILITEDQRAEGLRLYDMLFSEDNNNVRVRLEYGTHLILDRQFDRGRTMIRAIYGTLQNLIEVNRRSEISWEARYRVAQSYYLEFNDTADFDRKNQIGILAVNELDNVIGLAANHNLPERYDLLIVQAEDWRDILRSQLGI